MYNSIGALFYVIIYYMLFYIFDFYHEIGHAREAKKHTKAANSIEMQATPNNIVTIIGKIESSVTRTVDKNPTNIITIISIVINVSIIKNSFS